MSDDFSWLEGRDEKTPDSEYETWFKDRSARDLAFAAHHARRDEDISIFFDKTKRRPTPPPRSSVGASPVVAAIFATFPGAKIANVVVHDKRKKFLGLPGNRRVDL